MGPYRLKIAQADLERLEAAVFADLPREAGAFALAGIAVHQGGTDILVRRIVLIPKHLFRIQEAHRLEIAPEAINGLTALCEANGLGAVLIHSHPENIPYSPSDDFGEGRIFATLRASIPAGAPTASVLLYPGGVTGRVWLPGGSGPVPLSEIIVLGRHLKRIRIAQGQPGTSQADPIYDRQVRAFGTEGQALIAQSKVAIVGTGGTGSPAAEQLVRLGVLDLKLIDPQPSEDTNVTRMYGSFRRSWWGRRFSRARFKVDLVARHLKKINPRLSVSRIRKNVVLGSAARELMDRDIIFLCTDDHWGRSIVNQVAHQYLIPAINLGVRIASKDNQITAAVGVVDVLRPDLPCLWCTQFLRAERIAAESMPKNSRKSLEREGYVEGLDTPAPSVVSVTTAVAAMAVNLFLQQVTDFMGAAGDIARLNYDVMDGTVRRGRAMIPEKCICKKTRGFGDLKLMPTLKNLDHLEK